MMQWWESIAFKNPEFFWLFLLMMPAVAFYVWSFGRRSATLKISTTEGFSGGGSFLSRTRPFLLILRLLSISLMIVAMARPQTTDVTVQTKTTEGIDIVLAIDVSASMLAKDFDPDRLEATKEVATNFIQNRASDRIGVVVYAGESYTKTPVTTDKNIVLRSIRELEFSEILEQGTAIGMGLATSVNRLKESEALSKVIILMTDGENNAGFIDPKIASELAEEYGIKVYTIGIGSNGRAMSPVGKNVRGDFVFRPVKVSIDEELLQEIAADTGGKYYRATNQEKLKEIYQEIDALEKTEIEELKYYNVEEKFRPFLLIAAGLFFIELLLRFTLYKSVV